MLFSTILREIGRGGRRERERKIERKIDGEGEKGRE